MNKALLNEFLITILPGNEVMPAANYDFFAGYFNGIDQLPSLIELTHSLQTLTEETFNCAFETLNEPERHKVISLLKRRHIRLYSSVISHCLKAYYSDIRVLDNLAVGSSPPFPAGNYLSGDEWDLLEQVYNKGAIYRKVN